MNEKLTHKKLTPKQEQFCQNVASGQDGRTAYINAYDTNAQSRTAYNESYKLLKRSDITERITELRTVSNNHLQNQVIAERNKIKRILWDLIQSKQTKDNDRLRAIDILNRMNKEYTYSDDSELKQTNFVNISTNELKSIVNNLKQDITSHNKQ